MPPLFPWGVEGGGGGGGGGGQIVLTILATIVRPPIATCEWSLTRALLEVRQKQTSAAYRGRFERRRGRHRGNTLFYRAPITSILSKRSMRNMTNSVLIFRGLICFSRLTQQPQYVGSIPVYRLAQCNINNMQEERSLHSRWNFCSSLTEIHGDGERWPTGVTIGIFAVSREGLYDAKRVMCKRISPAEGGRDGLFLSAFVALGVVAMEGAGAAEKNFMFYTGSCEGNSQETLEKIRQNFLDAVKNSPIANQLLCTSSQDRDCVLNNVKVYCGSKSKRSGDSAAQQIVTFDFMIKDRHKSSDPKEEAAR